VWEKMVPKYELLKSIPLHIQGLNHIVNFCVLEDNVGEKALSSNWLTKIGHAKKTLFASFLSRMLKNVRIKFVFPYAMLPHQGAKQNTIRVTRKVSTKLPHCKGPALIYPILENKMPLICLAEK
jgi:hypothetical protein